MRPEWYAGCEIAGSLDAGERRGLRRFEMLCRNFARLERLVTGDIQFELPTDTSARVPTLDGTAAKQGAELANLERKRLNLGEDPLDDVDSIFDRMGIKVVGVRMPETSRVAGGFFFDSKVGPCLMMNSSAPAEERMISAAHQYCHFLADYNPYLPRLCLCGAPTGEDASEERAAGFAGAFLLPAGSLERLMTGNNGVGTEMDAIEALGIYYGVPMWAVVYRLSSLGFDVDPVEHTDWAGARGAHEDISADLPPRMVKLVLKGRSDGMLTPMRMARLLQMAPQNSEDLFSYYIDRVEREGVDAPVE